ncbi:MAG: hypothetical protein PHQ43_12580 [Dehalococcoidales bacterium]|nr:hypothetical protein [Dehalococcoidales bacterium]
MRGYPKHINAKVDFANLLAIPVYKARALEDLKRLQAQAVSEAKIVQVVSGSEETKDLVTKEIDNPNPRWKRLGFKDKEEVDTLVAAKEVVIDVK